MGMVVGNHRTPDPEHVCRRPRPSYDPVEVGDVFKCECGKYYTLNRYRQWEKSKGKEVRKARKNASKQVKAGSLD